MKEIFARLAAGQNLTEEEMAAVVEKIATGQVSQTQVAAFLLGLKIKGESPEELTGLAKVMQAKALEIPTQVCNAMDNCGTGGDQSNSFNISTTAAFVLAAGGIQMAKHGNRSISSKSGSADVLEVLGINLDMKPEDLGRVFDQTGMVFLFAKNLHPAMKYIMPARLELGVPTIMNLTGPLINPVPLKTQLLGTSRPDLLEMTAQTLQNMGRERAIVITGPNQMDEAALHGRNQLALLEKGHISLHHFEAKDLGLTAYSLEDICGGDAQYNAQILQAVLQNQPSPYLETVVLNAGLGFFANGKVDRIEDGIRLAREVIASGAALQKLKDLQEAQHG
ncbi:anthranilate phosphoribosyltransferase [Streptococcus sp.]|uniref:anthranilate phosphoribosyltransferase n=1 Tax=Streptococcus sp. TaxID=1306 RepID=UPI0035A006C0